MEEREVIHQTTTVTESMHIKNNNKQKFISSEENFFKTNYFCEFKKHFDIRRNERNREIERERERVKKKPR